MLLLLLFQTKNPLQLKAYKLRSVRATQQNEYTPIVSLNQAGCEGYIKLVTMRSARIIQLPKS
jgi:hypothetical protein